VDINQKDVNKKLHSHKKERKKKDITANKPKDVKPKM